jgi:hypothetical protein
MAFALESSNILVTVIVVPALKFARDPQQKPKTLNSEYNQCWYKSKTSAGGEMA